MKIRKNYPGKTIQEGSKKSAIEVNETLAVLTKTGEKTKWTTKMVEERFREAVLTLKKLPPAKARVYFNIWPDIVCTPNGVNFQKKKEIRVLATTDAIIKLDQTFEWMTLVTLEERKLIWMRAQSKHWKYICWEFGCDRSTAWRKWVIACTKIATTLNARIINGLGVATK